MKNNKGEAVCIQFFYIIILTVGIIYFFFLLNIEIFLGGQGFYQLVKKVVNIILHIEMQISDESYDFPYEYRVYHMG